MSRDSGEERSIGVDAALDLLTRFSSAHASTAGVGAILMETGCYHPPSLIGEALELRGSCIRLRLEASGATAVVVEDGVGDVYVELRSALGRVMHRARPVLADDVERLRGFRDPGRFERPEASAATECCGAARIAAAPPSPGDGDQLSQIDSAIMAGGAERRAWIGPETAAGVDPRVIPALFEHLCNTGLPAGVAVFSSDAAHIAEGVVHFVSGSDHGHLEAGLESGVLALDLRVVDECFLVPSSGPEGRIEAIELYDNAGEIIAMIGEFGVVGAETRRVWRSICASLPGPVRG